MVVSFHLFLLLCTLIPSILPFPSHPSIHPSIHPPKGAGSEAPLGRVYVDDPDDWDAADKSYAWDGPAHPLFSLQPKHGTIFAASVVREGR